MPEPTLSRRCWFRFSLRSLFALVVIVAIPLAWVAKERRHSQRELRIAMGLEPFGATVGYIGRFEAQPDAARALAGKPVAWWRTLLSSICGARVRSIKFNNQEWVVSPFSDASLLANLPNLEVLDLSLTQVEDLSGLSKLTRLRSLKLTTTPVRDLSPLRGLQNLETLSVFNTRISNVAPLAGLENLTFLDLSRTDVIDVAPLASLTSLANLNLRNTNVRKIESLKTLANLDEINIERSKVTRGQAQYLREALPHCKILHDPFTVFSIRIDPRAIPAKE